MPPWDERVRLDAGLKPSYATNVRRARADLIGVLSLAVTSDPSSKWLTGQLVRMLVDQGEFGRVQDVLTSCVAERFWCHLLKGYSAASMGDLQLAETAYREALRMMPAEHMCTLTDIAPLLEPRVRRSYADKSCAGRDSVNARLWWLADPLWIEPGNDRFTEQVTRAMTLELKRALSKDERFDWRDQAGSDARAEMVLRYGWPAYVHWTGPVEDSVISSLLRRRTPSSPPNPPYVSYEYGAGRLHLFPTSEALSDPLNANETAWSITAPAGGDTVIHFAVPETTYKPSDVGGAPHVKNMKAHYEWIFETHPRYIRETLWWPVEHYSASYRLVQLPRPELAFLRRHDHAVVATSTMLDSRTERPSGSVVEEVTLVIAPSPDTILFPARTRGVVGTGTVLIADIVPKPTLLGIEFSAGADGKPAGRTRFGISPPPPLSEMLPGDHAISDLVLLTPSGKESLPTATNEALLLMSPSPDVPHGSAIGLYWETYGFSEHDSVQIEVTVKRTTSQSIWRQLGERVGLARDLNVPIAIKWSESRGVAGTRVTDAGAVAIIARTLRVDVSKLTPGEYSVEVSVGLNANASVHSARILRIS